MIQSAITLAHKVHKVYRIHLALLNLLTVLYIYVTVQKNRKMNGKNNTTTKQLALVLIDMQSMFLTEAKESIIPNQVEILKFYNNQNTHLVVIESTGYGSTHHLLENEIAKFKAPFVQRVSKHASDGFSNQKLHTYLQQKSITDLLLMGINGCACVWATAYSALGRGYTIRTSKDLLHGFCSQECAQEMYGWYGKVGIFENCHEKLLTNELVA